MTSIPPCKYPVTHVRKELLWIKNLQHYPIFSFQLQMSGLPRPAMVVGNGRLNDSASNNSTIVTDDSDSATPKSRQRIQNDTSLGATAKLGLKLFPFYLKANFPFQTNRKRFVSLMTNSCDQTIELNDASNRLKAPKRRIYDVTNVLEGMLCNPQFSCRWLSCDNIRH